MIEDEDVGLTFSNEDFARRYSADETPGATGDRPQPQQVHANSAAPPLGRRRSYLIDASVGAIRLGSRSACLSAG